MTDIVERLREVAGIATGLLYSRREMLMDAADEIESLRHEAVKRLQTLTDANDNSARYCAELASMEQDIESLRSRAEKAEAENENLKENWSEARKAWTEAEADLSKVLEGKEKAEATCEKLAKALEKIAEQPSEYKDKYRSYGVGWAFNHIQDVARTALAAYRKEASE